MVTIHRRNYGGGHGYRDDEGLKVPGVTALVSDGLPKKALQKWAVGMVADYYVDHRDDLAKMSLSEARAVLAKAPYTFTEKAAARGSQAHDLAEDLMAGKQIAIPKGAEGFVKAAVSFIDEFDVIPVATEFTVYSETWRWAGTCDIVADLLDPDDPEPDPALKRRVRWLLDYKTKMKESGVFGDAALQLAPYRCAERMVIDGEDLPMFTDIERCGIVQLYADGTYRLVPVQADQEEYRIFQYVQQVALWLDSNRDLVGDPVKPPRTSTFVLTELGSDDVGMDRDDTGEIRPDAARWLGGLATEAAASYEQHDMGEFDEGKF